MARRLQRGDRLCQAREFRRVALGGHRTVGRFFVMVAAPSTRMDGSEAPRLGLTVSRRVGGSVVRNRVKRRIREWFRMSRERLAPGQDLVIIARRGAGELETREIFAALDGLAARARADG